MDDKKDGIQLGRVIESIENKLRPLTESFELIFKTYKQFEAQFKPVLDIILNCEERFLDFRERLSKNFERLLKGIERFSKDFPESTRKVSFILGKYGWYVSWNMELVATYELAELLIGKDFEKVDLWMADYYTNQLDNIQKDLLYKFPSRAKILDRAFGAHTRAEYELSIPVFLSQADGICQEIIGIQLYCKKNGKPETAKFVEQLVSDSLMIALLEPMRNPMPISANSIERKQYSDSFNFLNRHAILHGESIDYGTKINSLKAISLISYIGTVLLEAAREGSNKSDASNR